MINSTTRAQHIAISLCVDSIIVTFSVFMAYALRFDFTFPTGYINGALFIVALAIPVKLLTFIGFRLYKGMYRYSSIWDMLVILKATTVATVVLFVVVTIVHGLEGIPRSIFLLDYLATVVMIGGFRISIRLYFSHIVQKPIKSTQYRKKLLLIGAGNNEESIINVTSRKGEIEA